MLLMLLLLLLLLVVLQLVWVCVRGLRHACRRQVRGCQLGHRRLRMRGQALPTARMAHAATVSPCLLVRLHGWCAPCQGGCLLHCCCGGVRRGGPHEGRALLPLAGGM